MKTKIIKCFLCCIYLFSTLEVFAQKTPPPPKPNGGTPPVGLPIDDYIILLFLLGVVLGIYFLKRRKLTIQ
jgi:hypothetical protein